MWNQKPEHEADNQLFCQDPYTGTIKSKLDSNYCIAPSGNGLTLQPVNSGRIDQQMSVEGDRVHMRNDRNYVMDVFQNNPNCGNKVVMFQWSGQLNQLWEFIPASESLGAPSYQPVYPGAPAHGQPPSYGGQVPPIGFAPGPGGHQPPSPGYQPPPQQGYPGHQPGGYPGAPPSGYPGAAPPPSPGYGAPPGGGYAPPPQAGYGQPPQGYGAPPMMAPYVPPRKPESDDEPEPEPEEDGEEIAAPEVDPRKFYVISEIGGRVLDVRGSNLKPKAEVNIYDRKPSDELNQLFYQDDDGIIRSCLNRYTFDTSSGVLRLQPPNPNDPHRLWIIQENKIVNRADPSQCLEVPKAKNQNGRRVEPAAYHGQPHQHWYIDYINE